MSYTVLARRYRSREFDEVVGQEAIARTLRRAIDQDRIAHAYLFCGTRGVGKTSMARIFAKAINATDELSERDAVAEAIMRGEDLDVIEIDGASNRGIQEARDLIAGAGLSPARCRYKVYIIDEVHMLTTQAFNALLKTMEEPPTHVKFILATTDPHKVPATIQSRCQRFDFRALSARQIGEQLRMILEREGAEADEEVVLQIAKLGNGSMRDALSVLDRLLATGEERLTMDVLRETMGLPDHLLVQDLADAIAAADPAEALRRGDELIVCGSTEDQALSLLADHFRDVMLVATCGPDSELLEATEETRVRLAGHAERFDAAGLVHLIAMCDQVARSARGATTARALFDAALVRMCLAEHLADVAGLLAGGGAAAKKNPMPAEKKKTGGSLSAERPPARPVDRPAPGPSSPPDQPPTPAPELLPDPLPEPLPEPAAARAAAPPADPPRRDAPADELDPAALWTRLLDDATGSASLEAALDQVTPGELAGDRWTWTVRPEGRFAEGQLGARREDLEQRLERLAGRRITIRIERAAATGRAAGHEPAVSVDDPVVRQAADLFDGIVVAVEDAEHPPAKDA